MAVSVESPSLAGERKLTPMLRQYLDAKAEVPGAILMFRMGDFFELFFEDAEIAARELDIALTARDKDKDDPIPMAGVPHHAITGYVARLVDRGYTVALCDQVEDPKAAKGIVKREVVRVITPGTVSDLEALDPSSTSYLACVVQGEGEQAALGLLDLLAGELLCTELTLAGACDELQRVGAKEVLVLPSQRAALAKRLEGLPLAVSTLPDAGEEPHAALARRFDAQQLDLALTDVGAHVWTALGGLVLFAEATQRRALPHLQAPRRYSITDFLVLDAATRRNLELTHTAMEGKRQGSLLWHLDRCRTAVGSRRLLHWLSYPLKNLQEIQRRQDVVAGLCQAPSVRSRLQRALEPVRDIERLAGRIALGRATPKDLAMLRASLGTLPGLQEAAMALDGPLGQAWAEADGLADVRELLERALVDTPPHQANDGGIFQRGYHDQLDELIAASTDGHDILRDLERRERAATGIHNLKVGYNRVFGYFLEITRAHAAAVPGHYVRKQTLVGAERYITDELKRHEDRVLGADEKRRALELALYEALVGRLAGELPRLRRMAKLLGDTDALLSLAQVAEEGGYARPQLTPDPVLDIVAGRHPVVERALPAGEHYVPSDVRVDTEQRQVLMVTGPNMAGKSTAMRQTAIVTLLAHMGSFVPAERATVGLCDRIFTRVGASDNLSRGQSTFMVEMVETATILRHATRQSLVILDEIGRGTSTFDGVSIAWAVAEHLHDVVGCRTLFATHYHELLALADVAARVVNVSIAVEEHDGKIVFLRRLVEGGADRSYGIHVASLAGLPDTVLHRARGILEDLETRGTETRPRAHPNQLSLFAGAQRRTQPNSPPAPPPSPVAQRLASVDANAMTPLEALVLVHELQRELESGKHAARSAPPGT